MMNKQIQTPLVSDVFFKSLRMKRFIVGSDSLAHLMWRGYDLYCILLPKKSLPILDDLIVVECRIAGRKHCSYRVGIVKQVDSETLTLCYNHSYLNQSIDDWSIPMEQVKRIYNVDNICRDYARIRKFYPRS